DLLLLDYYLPDSNGMEVVKEIFNTNIFKPIILLTSHKDFRIAIEAMKYGVEDYLIKEEMVDTILPRTVINILERVQLNKRLLEAEKEKMILEKRMEAVQELVVTMCHEFNNPLAAIKISTDILMRQSTSDEQKNILIKFNSDITHLEKQIVKLRDINIDK
ncbi:MAG: response regulator, partial [Bacteroidota bacterium]|nr:response regulator [Bacteroidota bacterium]